MSLLSRLAVAAAALTVALSASAPAGAALPVPKITKLDPGYALPIGNDLVTISGENLNVVTGVLVDGKDVPFEYEGDGTITFFTPEHAYGVAQVRLRWAEGTTADNGLVDDLTYFGGEGPGPVVVTPKTGPVTGGTLVTIKGENLGQTLAVVFGDTELGTGLQIISDREIRVVSPPVKAPGTVNLIVINPAGANQDTADDDFTYTALPTLPKPVITALTPNWGVAGFGGVTAINVTNPGKVTKVLFGDKPAVKFWYSTKQVLAIAPPQPKGTVKVRVTSDGGTSVVNAASVYKYLGR